jgi:hypothetical protein
MIKDLKDRWIVPYGETLLLEDLDLGWELEAHNNDDGHEHTFDKIFAFDLIRMGKENAEARGLDEWIFQFEVEVKVRKMS